MIRKRSTENHQNLGETPKTRPKTGRNTVKNMSTRSTCHKTPIQAVPTTPKPGKKTKKHQRKRGLVIVLMHCGTARGTKRASTAILSTAFQGDSTMLGRCKKQNVWIYVHLETFTKNSSQQGSFFYCFHVSRGFRTTTVSESILSPRKWELSLVKHLLRFFRFSASFSPFFEERSTRTQQVGLALMGSPPVTSY